MTPERREQLRGLARRLGFWLLWLVTWIVRTLTGLVRIVWWRLNARGRVAFALAVLIVFAASTSSIAPSLSATAQGFGVLLLAGAGLWLIVTSPFRRRRGQW